MDCLNCGTEMITNRVITKKDDISYDMCEKCGSLWLDAGELDKMAFKVDGSVEYCEQDKEPEPEQTGLKCPRCDDSILAKVKFLESDDIFLHYCRNCGGFWLDGGELNLMDQELARIMPVRGKGFSDFVNNVHVPYWFKRVKTRSSETDFHIEVPPIKGATLEKELADVCPACGHSLNEYKAFSMLFEGCPKCKGIWLVKDELRKLKNKVEDGSLRWVNTEIENIEKTSVISTQRPCVTCETTKLVSVKFGKSSVLIDWCPQCHGMWLDRGEFETITEYLKKELLREHPKDIEKEITSDLKRVWSGGPESRLNEALDAKAAVSALLSTSIFEHPALFYLGMRMPRF
ncbi:MAG TPA: zf-TFIIB domain-containing protein [Candidatus Dormibacteraeota bacterium]|nr:zf-TFIIB domain-containing protein [Candidatus Dormibacteraeota bacterium]